MALDLNLYCEQLKEFRQRLASSDRVIKDAANRDYERCAGKAGFATRLMQIAHVSTARACLLRTGELSGWEREFLGTIVGLRTLSPRQRSTLSAISARVL